MPHVNAIHPVRPSTASIASSNPPVPSSQPSEARYRNRDRGRDLIDASTVPGESVPAPKAAGEATHTGMHSPVPRLKPPSTLAPREKHGHSRRSGRGAGGDAKGSSRRVRETSDQEVARVTPKERAGTMVEAWGEDEAIVGAYLLVFPLKQLDTLIGLALSGSKNGECHNLHESGKMGILTSRDAADKSTTNPATAHFLRHHITQAFEDFTDIQGELNNLNNSLCSPHTDEEWLTAAWGLHDRIENGKDLSSQVMRVATCVVNLEHERQWRSWWYWVQVKRQERRKEREKDAGEIKDGKGKDVSQTQEVNTELSLDMMGTKLPGIKKFRREISDEEKLATERMFYEAVLGELRKLPKWGGDGCFGAGERKDGRMAMVSAVEREEGMSIAEDLSKEEGAKRSDTVREVQTVAKETASAETAEKRGSKGVDKANAMPVHRGGREGSGWRRPLPDRRLSENHRLPSSSTLSSPSSRRGTQVGQDARDSARRGP